jgi:3-oxoadipate enol-lactonase
MPSDLIELQYVEHGIGGAGPVVLLHGFPLVGTMWDELVPALADCYHLIVPDLRGHGASEVTPGPYYVDQHARDVLALLDRLDIRQAAVVGLSMGGYVVMHLLQQAPDRTLAVVLADTRAPGDDEPRRQGRAAQAEVIRRDGLHAFADIVLPRMFSAAAFDGRPDLVDRFRQIIVGQKPESVIAGLEGLAARPSMVDALRAVRCPTLVIVGSEDVTTTPEDADEFASVIHGSELLVVEDVGHMANWEAPEAFNRAVRDFLDKTVGPRANTAGGGGRGVRFK